MRIFVALDIDEDIRQRIARFLDGIREIAPDARWVGTESLHVTLKFIGEQSADRVQELKTALSHVTSEPFQVTFRSFGFFPNSAAARVFWIGIESGPALRALATAIETATFSLGVAREDHPFSPHLTLARGGSGTPSGQKGDRPNRRFARLQEKLAVVPHPDFGTMTAREFFIYESQLGKGGSRYAKLFGFPLTAV
jgi:RNA 2',3'-cyclic 3'-phosphodiesterase